MKCLCLGALNMFPRSFLNHIHIIDVSVGLDFLSVTVSYEQPPWSHMVLLVRGP